MVFELNDSMGVSFECFKEVYQLTATLKKNGKHLPQYAKYQKEYGVYHNKDRPVQVKIGSKEQVVQMCLAILQEVTGVEYDEKLPI